MKIIDPQRDFKAGPAHRINHSIPAPVREVAIESVNIPRPYAVFAYQSHIGLCHLYIIVSGNRQDFLCTGSGGQYIAEAERNRKAAAASGVYDVGNVYAKQRLLVEQGCGI